MTEEAEDDEAGIEEAKIEEAGLSGGARRPAKGSAADRAGLSGESGTAGQGSGESGTAGQGSGESGTAGRASQDHEPAGQGRGTGSADDPAVDAWRGLLIAHSRLVPAVEAELRAAGQIPLSWYDVLLELNAAPERRLRMSELGQRVVLSRTRVSRIVDELAAAGLAGRQPDEADGRSSFAVLTDPGREALRRAWPVYREAIRRHLGERLTGPQCRELAALLSQVITAAEPLPRPAAR